ncbi:MAG: alkaline phosphatase family protein [Actinomycetota bacterium]
MHHTARPRASLRIALVFALLVMGAACTQDEEPNDGRPRDESAFPEPRFTPLEPEGVTSPVGDWLDASCALDPELFERMMRGYYPGRSPGVLWLPRTPNFFGGFVQTGHSGPWDYLQEVPLVFYGPGFIRPVGPVRLDREVTVADIAPTLGELLNFDFPTPDGRVLDKILVPSSRRTQPPKVIVVVAWDGGGTNVLEAWPDFWPELGKLMRDGASLEGATVASSPSVTPATHTTMGTGVMPNKHGAVGIYMRRKGRLVNSFGGKDADLVKVPMLGDVYDVAVGNQAQLGLLAYKSWHLGMMSHGAHWPGGDQDMAVFVDVNERLVSTPGVYYKPDYVNQIGGLRKTIAQIDLRDGKRDGRWLGHDILDDPRYRRDTSVWAVHQTKVIKTLLRREGYGADEITDLFFTNYKQPDEAGHNWNMLSPEVPVVLEDTDAQLKELKRYLNQQVGREQWVMVVTADHGQQPDAIKSHGWPIAMNELVTDIAEHFGQDSETFVEGEASGAYLDPEAMQSEGITREEVSDFIINYRLRDNLSDESEVPEQYRPRLDEPIFEAAFPEGQADRVRSCLSD